MICKGIITDLVGQPIPKAIITIKSIRGATAITSSVYFHQCDDKGEYNFSLLEGKYKIWIQNSNFSDKNLVGVGVVESDTPDGDIDSILVAEDTPTPDEPITPSGCECSWIKKTLIPTYFYITLDSTAEDLTDSDVEEIIKNTDVTVISEEGFGMGLAEIPKQFPLIYLGKTAEGYKYAFPYSLADTINSSDYPTGHEKSILIQLHNRLSQYNTENSSYMHGLTETNGTRIYRDSYGVGGKWPATNKIILSLAAYDRKIYPNLIPEHTLQDTAKVYYYKHIDNEIEAVPMTFEFLETVRQYTTEVEDKPEDTPETPEPPTPEPPTPEPPTPEIPEDYITPVGVVEGVLSPYTLKVRFTNKSWYREPGRFSVYNNKTKTWKAATKIVGDVVYFVFTEEEAIFTKEEAFSNVWGFKKHPPMPFQSMNSMNCTHILYGRNLLFVDTIMDDVVNIDDDIYDTDHIDDTTYVNVGSAYI